MPMGPLFLRSVTFDEPANTVTVTGLCTMLRTPWALTCRADGYRAFMEGGALVQDALPELTAHERELLVSGTTAEGWAHMFPDEDDEDPDVLDDAMGSREEH